VKKTLSCEREELGFSKGEKVVPAAGKKKKKYSTRRNASWERVLTKSIQPPRKENILSFSNERDKITGK